MEPERTGSKIETVARLGFLALVFSLAFMKPSVVFAGQRIVPTDMLFPLVAVLLAAAMLSGAKRFRWKPAYWVFAGYFAAMAVSAYFSEDSRGGSLKLLGIAYLVGLGVMAAEFITKDDDLRSTIFAWLSGLCLAVVIDMVTAVAFTTNSAPGFLAAFVYHQGAAPAGSYSRISSTFITPSMLCNYLNVGLVLAFIAWRKDWLKKSTALTLMAAIVICSLLTVSIGIGAVALTVGILLWLLWRRERPITARLSLVAGIVILVLFLATAFVAVQAHDTAPYSLHLPVAGKVSPSPRLLVWEQAIQTFLADPLTGIGLGSPTATVRFRNSDGSMSLLTDAHNVFLSVAAQAGIIGLAALITLVVYVLRLAFSKRNSGDRDQVSLGLGIAFLVAFGVQGLTGSFEDARHLWILIGMIVGVTRTRG